MRLEGSGPRQKSPAPYKSPLHGPADKPREREWLRFQVQGHDPGRYWVPVAETDDRNRALAEAVKRARVGTLAYRVWDRLERKEIWQGFGPHATIDEWKTKRPEGLVGQNRRRAMTVPLDLRYKLIACRATLDGRPAKISGAKEPFALVRTLDGKMQGEWSWDAVLRICRAGGRFKHNPRTRRNPVLSKRMQSLRPGTMRLGDAMRYGKALLDAGYVIRVWDGSGWEVVIHPDDSMATSSGKGPKGGRDYLARGAGMVKTWPITLIAYRGQQSLGWMTPDKIRPLIRHKTALANSAQETPTFFVMHVSVDGAGIHTKGITLKRKAVALAQKLQAKSDKRGNRWGYHYIVYRQYESGRSDAIYRTKSKASANWNGSRRQKIALMNSSAIANARAAHTAIVSAFMAGKSRRFGTSPEMPGSRYATDGQQLKVWGHVVAEKVPGGIRLSDAGYQTLLTKNVLNTVLDALGYSRISQMRHRWYIGSKEWPGEAVIPRGTLTNRRRSARANKNKRRRARPNNGKPTLTLAVFTSERTGKRTWQVMYQGQPICAETTEDRARKVLDDARKKMPHVKAVLWDGDAGKESALPNRGARRNAFGPTPYYQSGGKIHRWGSGQLATLPKTKTLVTVYLPGVDATVFQTWVSSGERHWKALTLHRHFGNKRRAARRTVRRTRTRRNCHTLLGKAAARRAMKFA